MPPSKSSPPEEENIRRGGPSAVPACSLPGGPVTPPTLCHPSFCLPPLVYPCLSAAPEVRKDTAPLAQRSSPRFTSCFLPPRCLFRIPCVSPFGLPNPHPAHRAGCPISPLCTSHNSSLPHFSSIIPHYYSHPLLPFFFPGTSYPSSLHVFPILSINSSQCDTTHHHHLHHLSPALPNPDEFQLPFPRSPRTVSRNEAVFARVVLITNCGETR